MMLRWVYYGLQTGLLSRGRFQQVFEKKSEILGCNPAAAAADGAEAQEGMAAQGRGTVSRLSSVCQNGLETAVVMFVDSDSKQRMNMIEAFGGPLQQFCSEGSKECRCTDDVVAWALRMVQGGYFVHLLRMLKLLNDVSQLSSMGLVFEARDKTLGADHPFYAEQEDYAASVGQFCFCLLRVRLHLMVRDLRGWVLRLPIFGDGAPASLQTGHMKQLHGDIQNYARLRTQTGNVAKAMVERSLFQTLPTQQVHNACCMGSSRSEGWFAKSVVEQVLNHRQPGDAHTPDSFPETMLKAWIRDDGSTPFWYAPAYSVGLCLRFARDSRFCGPLAQSSVCVLGSGARFHGIVPPPGIPRLRSVASLIASGMGRP